MFPSRIPVISTAGASADAFVSTWVVPGGDKTLTLPFVDDSNTINFTIDWGDGSSDVITAYDDADLAHTYGSGGTYTITMEGTISGFKFNDAGDKTQITDISNWGNFNISTDRVFMGCTALNVTAADAPIISSTSLNRLFYNNQALTSIGNADLWDVSLVEDMVHAFNSTVLFNQDITGWDVSEVTDLGAMFHTSAFNQNISVWDVAKVEKMNHMFTNNTAFNQPIGVWDVGVVTHMHSMFYGATSFNQDISEWNIQVVSTMANMFEGANALSTANYDDLLVGWNANTHLNDVSFHAGNADPTATGITARGELVGDGWTIVDNDGTHT